MARKDFGFFEFVVKYWNEFDKKEEVIFGLTAAETYTEAMDRIETYYGDTLMSVTIAGVEPSPVYEFEEDNGSEIFKNTYAVPRDKFISI